MTEISAELRGFTLVPDAIVRDCGYLSALVWGAVRRYCSMADGVCYASQAKIGGRVGLARETVNEHLQALVAKGYLRDLTPDLVGRAHRYADTGKVKISGQVEASEEPEEDEEEPEPVSESHRGCEGKSQVPVSESHRGCEGKSQVPVSESHTKKAFKRQEKPPEETLNTHGGVSPPGVGVPGPLDGAVLREVVEQLARHFAEKTGLELPRAADEKQQQANKALWGTPLREIAQLAGSATAGEELIDRAVDTLWAKECIVKAPRSLLATARALSGKRRAKEDPRRYCRGRYGSRVKT